MSKMENSNQTNSHSSAEENAALNEIYNNIKNDSKEFVTRVKKLSDSGMHDAKELLESVKSNWHFLVKSLSEFSPLWSKAKKAKVKKVTKKLK